MQKFSYHTHTLFSDGKNTAEEMVKQAHDLGWQEMGVSDHLIVHKNLKQSYSWEDWKSRPQSNIFNYDWGYLKEPFQRHVEELHKLGRKYNIDVKVGAEVDFFLYDGWYEEFLEFYKETGMDYVISGNHFLPIKNGEIIIDAGDAEILSAEELDEAFRLHFHAINEAAKCGTFRFIAHPDFIRKARGYDKDKFMPEKIEIIKSMELSGTAVEMSTKGLRKQGRYYPDDNWLDLFIEHNIPFVISDDAHRITELGYEFEAAEAYLAEKHCSKRWKYKE